MTFTVAMNVYGGTIDLITRSDVQRRKRDDEGAGPVRGGEAAFCAGQRGVCGFERRDLFRRDPTCHAG